MVNLHITRGEVAEILTEKLADNSRNSRGSPGGIGLLVFVVLVMIFLYRGSTVTRLLEVLHATHLSYNCACVLV